MPLMGLFVDWKLLRKDIELEDISTEISKLKTSRKNTENKSQKRIPRIMGHVTKGLTFV
jgi:hypothetical protein